MQLIAYANIQQPFPFEQIPLELVPEKLRLPATGNARVQQRHQCRRLAHFLLWQLLKTFVKNTALLPQIARTASGRPYFPNQQMDFNISHSGDWVAVLLQTDSDSQSAVGIDIETGKTRNFGALMDYFAQPAEIAWFAQQQDAQRAFYRCWCLREAVLKSQGVGIVKLSEVEHRPQNLRIFSDYCPQGQLIFSAELPFYLAAFSNQIEPDWQIFYWHDQKLTPQNLLNPTIYQVN